VKKHPLKRALRLDKMTIAALEATLKLYRDPERLGQRLPTLRLLTRQPEDMREMAQRIAAALRTALGDIAIVEIEVVVSQIGSGSQPVERLPSVGIGIRPAAARHHGRVVEQWADAFRALPIPVIGRIAGGALIFDLRCLEPTHEQPFIEQLPRLAITSPRPPCPGNSA
jgi:L-seryl-tRNA(Ser) seleniumtransferase